MCEDENFLNISFSFDELRTGFARSATCNEFRAIVTGVKVIAQRRPRRTVDNAGVVYEWNGVIDLSSRCEQVRYVLADIDGFVADAGTDKSRLEVARRLSIGGGLRRLKTPAASLDKIAKPSSLYLRSRGG